MIAVRILRIRNQILPQCLVREDIDAHRGKVALRMSRLLFELDDHVILVAVHDAEAACFL